jgi:hypothetical protein
MAGAYRRPIRPHGRNVVPDESALAARNGHCPGPHLGPDWETAERRKTVADPQAQSPPDGSSGQERELRDAREQPGASREITGDVPDEFRRQLGFSSSQRVHDVSALDQNQVIK